MKTYHAYTDEHGQPLTDDTAVALGYQYAQALNPLGGELRVSKGFNHGTVLVLTLPEDVEPSELFPDIDFTEYPQIASE